MAPCLGFGEDSKEAGYFETAGDGDSPTAPFIDEKEASVQFRGDDKGFGPAGVELFKQDGDLVLVPGGDDTRPRAVELKFLVWRVSAFTAGGTTISA